MTMIAEIAVSFFLVVGGVFGLVGSLGLLKLRDTMQRLHAPTKATTLGVGGVLIASMVYMLLVKDQLSFHELLITLFLFITAPVTAHVMAQAHVVMNRDTLGDLPDTQRAHGWSVFDDPPMIKRTREAPEDSKA